MTPTGACFTPAHVRLTRAFVRFAPSSALLMPGPDDSGPASVPQPRPGAFDEDAPPSPGPVSVPPASGTKAQTHAAILAFVASGKEDPPGV